MQNFNAISNLSVENKSNFQLRHIKVKNKSNESLLKLVQQAIDNNPTQVLVTPRIDVAGYAYYWIGIRFDHQELDFKLLINEQIGHFILAYLKGETELPSVTNFEPTKTVENPEEWLREHQAFHMQSAISFKEELTMREDVNYLTTKLIFKNGKVIYPSTKCEDILSLILI